MKKITFIVALIFAIAELLASQGSGLQQQRWKQRLLDFKKMKLMEILNLDEQTSVKFLNRYTDFSKNMDKIEEKRDEIVNQIEGKIRKGERDDYDKLIQSLIDLDKEEYELKNSFYRELKSFMTEEQVGKVIVFERNFRRELINTLRDIQRERMMRRRPF